MTLANTVKLPLGAKHNTKHYMSKPTLHDGGTPATLTLQGNEVINMPGHTVCKRQHLALEPGGLATPLCPSPPSLGFSPYCPDKKSAVWMGSGLPVRCRVSTKPLIVQSGPDWTQHRKRCVLHTPGNTHTKGVCALVTQWCLTLCDSMAPLSMEFSKQEC